MKAGLPGAVPRVSSQPRPAVPELGSGWAGVLRDRGHESFDGCSSPTTSPRVGRGSCGRVEGAFKASRGWWEPCTQGPCSIFPRENASWLLCGDPAPMEHPLTWLPRKACPPPMRRAPSSHPSFSPLTAPPMGSSPGARCPSQNSAFPIPPSPALCLVLPRRGTHPSGMGIASS